MEIEETNQQPPATPHNTYALDAESSVEMARLMRQDHLLTQGMGGIFPEQPDLTQVQRLLDIACGPGGWVLETAFTYADIDVVGVDISETMIRYARSQAQVQHLDNASFQVMDVLQPLAFPDHSFDLVNARTIVAFMLPEAWPTFLEECLRVLRPGGILRLTDFEWGFSNKPALEHYCGLFNQALTKSGQSFSPHGMHLGLLPMLRRLMQNAGCQQIGNMAHVIEFSFDTEAHEGFYHHAELGLKLLQPFMCRWGVAAPETLDTLYAQVLQEMQMEDFCAIWILLTVWGCKPRAEG
jgi:ubiquinone/menaquinone biosynthesis C-methylase UbiE